MHRRYFLVRSSQAALALGLLPRLAACRREETTSQDGPFTALRDRYFLKALELNPVTATYLGGDGYDPSLAKISGRLRDWRPEALEAERKSLREIEAERSKIDPATLSPEARIDHAVLGAQLAFLLRQSGERRSHERAIDTYVAEPFRGVDWQIQGMAERGTGQQRNGDRGNRNGVGAGDRTGPARSRPTSRPRGRIFWPARRAATSPITG